MPKIQPNQRYRVVRYDGHDEHPYNNLIVRTVDFVGEQMWECEVVGEARTNLAFFQKELESICMFHGGEQHEHS